MKDTVIILDELLGDSLMASAAITKYYQDHLNDKNHKLTLIVNKDRPYHTLFDNQNYFDTLVKVSKSEIEALAKKYNRGIFVETENKKVIILDTMKAFNYVNSMGTVVSTCFGGAACRPLHLAYGYADQLGVDLKEVKYNFHIDSSVELKPEPKSILVASKSTTCTSQDPKVGIANKMLDVSIWNTVIEALPDYKFYFTFAPTETPLEGLSDKANIINNLDFLDMAQFMCERELIISIDTGIAHLAEALKLPLILINAAVSESLIFPDIRGNTWIIDHSLTNKQNNSVGIQTVTAEEIINVVGYMSEIIL